MNARAFFFRKYASTLGILAAALLLYFVSSSCVNFSFLKAIVDFPGGFVWFVQQFFPQAGSFDHMEKISSALFKTVLDAIAAGTLGALVSYVLAVLASRVSGFGGIVQLLIRAFATVLRNIPTVAWGFILLFSFKQSEFTGYLALFFKSIGFLTRAFIESIDEVDSGAIEALKATGAGRFQIMVRGIIPLSLTQIVSWTLYMIETNFRDATLVGMLTGSGIGFVFNWYYRSFRYPVAGLVIIFIAVAVIAIELVSNFVRRRIDTTDGCSGGIQKSYRQRIKTHIRTESSTALGILFVCLAFLSLFTFIQMDYGKANVAQASVNLLKYLGIMGGSPHLVNYTVEETAQAMAVTLSIAFLATLGGAIIAFVLGLFAASNLSSARVSNVVKAVMALIRSVPTIIWVLVFTVAIGLGAEAAVVGMMFHTVSFLTKAFSEAFEETDAGVLEALRATGASWFAQITRGVIPEKMSELLSWSFIRFENNFVGAVTVGAIAGSGGIGYQLYMVANYMFDWHEVGLIVYLCLGVSVILEVCATQLRKRFIVVH